MPKGSRIVILACALGLAGASLYARHWLPQPAWQVLLLVPLALICWAAGWLGGLMAAPGAAGLAVLAEGKFRIWALWEQWPVWAAMALGFGVAAGAICLGQAAAQRWRGMHDRAVESLAAAIDSRYEWSRGRSGRVAYYAVAIGRRLGVRGKRTRSLYLAALLRDVGTLSVPHDVLAKKGVLSGPQRIEVEAHPGAGVHILASIGYSQEVLDAVHHHHERSDGTGYPAGLTARQTPLLAKIVAVADAFEALTHDRPYRPALPPVQAISTLRSEPYSPEVVDALAQALEAGEVIVSGPVRGDSAVIRPARHAAPVLRVP